MKTAFENIVGKGKNNWIKEENDENSIFSFSQYVFYPIKYKEKENII